MAILTQEEREILEMASDGFTAEDISIAYGKPLPVIIQQIAEISREIGNNRDSSLIIHFTSQCRDHEYNGIKTHELLTAGSTTGV